MSFKEKFNDYFSLNEADPDEGQVTEKPKRKEKKNPVRSTQQYALNDNKEPSQNVVALNQQSIKNPRIKILEPRLYSEVQSVADLLLENQSVILNFRRMEKKQAKKMIDFLMGTTYAIKGDIQRLGEEIFICTPQSFEVEGTEIQELKNMDF